MRTKLQMTMMAMGFLLLATHAEARNVRATDMNSKMWAEATRGKFEDLVIEFRQGDQIPVTLTAQGDLIETARNEIHSVSVKRNFWLRFLNNDMKVSLDGENFRPIPELLTGSLQVGAATDGDAGGVVNGINVIFDAKIKNGGSK